MSDIERRRLTSWKEIASHLRREVRTVIRWEKERGLPVHRVPGGRGRSVFAYTDELDRWSAGGRAPDAEPPSPTMRWKWIGVAAGLALLPGLAAGIAIAWPHGDIARVAVEAHGVRASTRTGRMLWIYPLASPAIVNNRRQTQIADLDGDGRADVIASLDVIPEASANAGLGQLLALDHGGRPIW